MSKIKSRKLWAFITWSVLFGLSLILGRNVDPENTKWYGIITLAYILTQGSIDAIIKWKLGKKDD
jgi:hypothetical protein